MLGWLSFASQDVQQQPRPGLRSHREQPLPGLVMTAQTFPHSRERRWKHLTITCGEPVDYEEVTEKNSRGFYNIEQETSLKNGL